jgi:hypothetical protein
VTGHEHVGPINVRQGRDEPAGGDRVVHLPEEALVGAGVAVLASEHRHEEADPPGQEFPAATDAEVGVDHLDVLVDRVPGQPEPGCDLLVRVPLQQAAEHLADPRRQFGRGWVGEPSQRPADEWTSLGVDFPHNRLLAGAVVPAADRPTHNHTVHLVCRPGNRPEAPNSVVDADGQVEVVIVPRPLPLAVGHQV